MKHVVHLSGGECSWAAARRVADTYGTDDMILLFADVKYEDEETYAFLDAAAAQIGLPITKIAEGRDPWTVFMDEGFVGNSRVDPCSRILKRELLDRWYVENFTPQTVTRYVGIHWSESDRFYSLERRMLPWVVKAPLCEKPFMGIEQVKQAARAAGLPEQRLYKMGFSHANCGGRCVKAGQGHWAQVYHLMRDRYDEVEGREQAAIAKFGPAATMLNDRRGGTRKPMSLLAFRARIESGDYDKHDKGGCGCFSGTVEPTPPLTANAG